MKILIISLSLFFGLVSCTTDDKWWDSLLSDNSNHPSLSVYSEWRMQQAIKDQQSWLACKQEHTQTIKFLELCIPLIADLFEKYAESQIPMDVREFNRYLHESSMAFSVLRSISVDADLDLQKMALINGSRKIRDSIMTIFKYSLNGEKKQTALDLIPLHHRKPYSQLIMGDAQKLSIEYPHQKFALLQMVPKKQLNQNVDQVLRILQSMRKGEHKRMVIELLPTKKRVQNFDILFGICSNITDFNQKWPCFQTLPRKLLNSRALDLIHLMHDIPKDFSPCPAMALLDRKTRDENIHELLGIIKEFHGDFVKWMALRLFSRAVLASNARQVFDIADSMKDSTLIWQVYYLFSADSLYNIATTMKNVPEQVYYMLFIRLKQVEDVSLRKRYVKAIPLKLKWKYRLHKNFLKRS